MRYAQLVMGPAGSGKSTFCATMAKHAEVSKRIFNIVNLGRSSFCISKKNPRLEVFRFPYRCYSWYLDAGPNTVRSERIDTQGLEPFLFHRSCLWIYRLFTCLRHSRSDSRWWRYGWSGPEARPERSARFLPRVYDQVPAVSSLWLSNKWWMKNKSCGVGRTHNKKRKKKNRI